MYHTFCLFVMKVKFDLDVRSNSPSKSSKNQVQELVFHASIKIKRVDAIVCIYGYNYQDLPWIWHFHEYFMALS